jgi:prepilin-type N-terminal cleavage/methylation domain-containing protein
MRQLLLKKQCSGLTLIEVLIATFILSVGFLAITHLQLMSLRYTQAAYLSSFAEVQLFKMGECLQLTSLGHACQEEKSTWEKELVAGLPEGMGKVFKKASSFQVIVAWNDKWIAHLGKSCSMGIPSHLTCIVMEIAL